MEVVGSELPLFLGMRVLTTLFFALAACLVRSVGARHGETCRLRPLGHGRDDTDQVYTRYTL